MRSMWRRRLVRSSRDRAGAWASEAPASLGFGWTSAAGRAVVVAISSPSSARRDLRRGPIRRQRAVRDRRVARVYVTDGTRGSGLPLPFGRKFGRATLAPDEHGGWIL